MRARLEELQAQLYQEIPITRHFNLRVASYDGARLWLEAPLAENVNHKGTAFGGSLSAILTLAGWSIVWFLLKEEGIEGEIVIQDSHCEYLAPVTRDFAACSYRPDEEVITRFIRMLTVHKKARIELAADIFEGDMRAVAFRGRFVVLC